MMNELIRKAKRSLEIHTRLYLKQEMPVVIYCSGRVGSMAMYHSLEERGVFVFKVEDMSEKSLSLGNQPGTSRWVLEHIVRPKRRAKFILLTRNPVAVIISDFFPKLGWLASPTAYKDMSIPELIELFNTRYFEDERHLYKMNWFDIEPKSTMGVDVFEHPFLIEDGYTRFQHEQWDILVLRTELDDAKKAAVVGEFLELDNLEIMRFNVGETKPYATEYRAFKEQLVIPQPYLEAIYESQYARHFYGREQMKAMNQQWAER